jgi:hypothetical protein
LVDEAIWARPKVDSGHATGLSNFHRSLVASVIEPGKSKRRRFYPAPS